MHQLTSAADLNAKSSPPVSVAVNDSAEPAPEIVKVPPARGSEPPEGLPIPRLYLWIGGTKYVACWTAGLGAEKSGHSSSQSVGRFVVKFLMHPDSASSNTRY
jgi:hypothetical protein